MIIIMHSIINISSNSISSSCIMNYQFGDGYEFKTMPELLEDRSSNKHKSGRTKLLVQFNVN